MLLTLNGPAIPPVFDRVVITCCSLETGVCRWHYKPSVFCILAVNDSREIKIYYHHICIIVAPDICHCCHMNICQIFIYVCLCYSPCPFVYDTQERGSGRKSKEGICTLIIIAFCKSKCYFSSSHLVFFFISLIFSECYNTVLDSL